MSTRWVSLLSNHERIELSTSAVFPPIPTRKFDWSAIDRNTYDPCGDEDCACRQSLHQGSGSTEAEAIDDLFDQMEDR